MSSFVFGDIPPPPPSTISAREAIKETQPIVQPETYISTVVDPRFTDIAGLVPYISGSAWKVNYYSQVKGSSQELSSFGSTTHPIYQQYIEVLEFDLRVDGNLEPSQNVTTSEMELTGRSTVSPHFIPNVGDTFFGDIGDGREGVFFVRSTERLTTMLQTAYSIEYAMIGFATEIPNLLTTLKRKVVKTLYYHRDFLRYGKYPFLVEEGVVRLRQLAEVERYLVQTYIQDFYNQTYGSLIAPTPESGVYDHYVVKFLIDLLDISEYPQMRQLKPKNVGGSTDIKRLNFWSLLQEMDIRLLSSVEDKMWLVSTRLFSRWAEQGTIYHSQYERVVFPRNRKPNAMNNVSGDLCGCTGDSTDLPLEETLYGEYPFYEAVDGSLTVTDIVRGENDPLPPEDDDTPMAPIHAVLVDNYYVFSKYFYEQADKGQSMLEWMVSNVLENKPYDTRALIDLSKDIKVWRPLERFYYIPVMLLLIMYAKRGHNVDGTVS